MRTVVTTAVAAALLIGFFGFATWTEPMGGGIDRVGTTLISAVGGAVLGAAIGLVTLVVRKLI